MRREREKHGIVNFHSLLFILKQLYLDNRMGFDYSAMKADEWIENRLIKANQHAGTAAFSEVNNNLLLWAHYGSQHKGICLEFDCPGEKITLLKKTFAVDIETYVLGGAVNFPTIKYEDRGLHQVIYRKHQMSISYFNAIHGARDEPMLLSGYVYPTQYRLYEELKESFTSKTHPWEYEAEWRIIEFALDFEFKESRIRYYPLESLKAIYFGYRTSSSTKELIKNIFKDRHLSLAFFDAELRDGNSIKFSESSD